MKNIKWTVLVHFGPHTDEMLGVYLLKKYGRKMFPGIEKCIIQEITDEELRMVQRGRTEQQLRDEKGVIMVGIGLGVFDEHSKDGNGREPNTSAALLVAKFLGVADDPTLVRLLNFVTKNDDQGGNAPEFGLPSMVNHINRLVLCGNPQGLYRWLEIAFEAEQEHQREYHEAVRLADRIQVSKVYGGITAVRLDLTGKKDNTVVHTLMLRKADAVVIKRPDGHVQIYARKGKINLYGVANGVRYGELRARRVLVPRDVDLGAEGTIECVPNWHYDDRAGWIFNGSLSHPGHLKTEMSFDAICGIVAERVRLVTEEPKRFGPTVISSTTAIAVSAA